MSAVQVHNLPAASQADGLVEEITRVDTGLGTTYERWALNRYLAALQSRLQLAGVLEGPGDGMTGISGLNSLGLGKDGAQVTLLLANEARGALARQAWKRYAPQAQLEVIPAWRENQWPFAAGAFDLAWNFNVINRQPDPQATLDEMVRVSRRYVLIFVPNRRNYGFGVHRLHHRVSGETWDHGHVALLSPQPWKHWLAERGLQVREIVYLDCPWWPDIVDLGKLLSDFLPFMKVAPFNRLVQQARPENRSAWTVDELPYYDPQAHPAIHARMERLAVFERSRSSWLQQRFAHHVGILAEKRIEPPL